eukprot:Lankesteria_metandrocarpae@DN5579_c0_g1_i1.p1
MAATAASWNHNFAVAPAEEQRHGAHTKTVSTAPPNMKNAVQMRIAAPVGAPRTQEMLPNGSSVRRDNDNQIPLLKMPAAAETHHSVQLLQQSTSTAKVPKMKAVVVGINYINSTGASLAGCANDAYLFALTLVNTFHFEPHNILLLLDALPSSCYTAKDPSIDVPDGVPGVFPHSNPMYSALI